ncbi:MAG: hypothetical protein MK076_02470 [Flavobacteriales bacterium]|nr:hypothetical protein [Flavobacteriales bacterium]
MKKLLLLLVITSFSLTAQINVGKISLDFGETTSEKDGEIIIIAGEKNGNIYALARRKKDFYSQTFDATTKNLKSSTRLDFDKINGGKLLVEDLAFIGDKLYLMLSYFDKKNKTYNFIAKEIQKNTIVRTIYLLSAKVDNRSNKCTFVFTKSYDNFNYLVAHVGLDDRKNQLKYSVKLFDDRLAKVFDDSYINTFNKKNNHLFDFSDVQVNEHGDVLIATTESYRDKKKKTNINNITIHSYLANRNYEQELTKITLTGKRAVNCSLIETKDNTLHAIGFYSNLKKNGKAKITVEGIYDIAFDYEKGKVIKKNFNDFTLEIKKQLIGERRAKNGKDLKPFYTNIAFVERENGGVIVLSEFKLIFESGSTGFGPLSVTSYSYNTNEIIVTALNKDGTLDWSNVIPKEQRAIVSEVGLSIFGFASSGGASVSASAYFPLAVISKGPEFLSAIPIYHNGQLTVIVNDDPRNIGITKMDDVKKVKNINKMIPVAFTFDEQTGAISRIDPKNFEKKQIVLRPFVIFEKSSKNYLIYGGNKKGNAIGELKLN